MKVYISGPMTGYPHGNRPAFADAADELYGAGHEPINPADSFLTGNPTWAEFMRADIALLIAAEGVAVLPGWEASRGARLEVDIAHALGMRVLPIERWAS